MMRSLAIGVFLLTGCKERAAPANLDAQLSYIKTKYAGNLHPAEDEYLSHKYKWESEDDSQMRYLKKMLNSVYKKKKSDPITHEELKAGLALLRRDEAPPSTYVVEAMEADWENLTDEQKTRLKTFISVDVNRVKELRSRKEGVGRQIDAISEKYSNKLDQFEVLMLRIVRHERDMSNAKLVKYYSDTLAIIYDERRKSDPVTEEEIREMLSNNIKLRPSNPAAIGLNEFLQFRFKTSTNEQRTRIKAWLYLLNQPNL